MITNKPNRRHALKMLLAGSVAASAAVTITGCGLAQRLPVGQTGASTDGEALSNDVREALLNNPATAQLQVSIRTVADEVVIGGYVPNQSDIYNIEQVANTVPGVRHVLMDVYVNN